MSGVWYKDNVLVMWKCVHKDSLGGHYRHSRHSRHTAPRHSHFPQQSRPIISCYCILHFWLLGFSWEVLKDWWPGHLSNLIRLTLISFKLRSLYRPQLQQEIIAKLSRKAPFILIVPRITYFRCWSHSNARYDPLTEPLRFDVPSQVNRHDQRLECQYVPLFLIK